MVVEERYSQVSKLDRVRPIVVAAGIAECHLGFPTGPIVSCETRKLAQEWTYRFLAAARVGPSEEMVGNLAVRGLEASPPLAPALPTPADVRHWAMTNNFVVSDRAGSLRCEGSIPQGPRPGRDLRQRSFASVGAR